MQLIDPVLLGLSVTQVSGDEAYVLCPYHHDGHQSAAFNMQSGLFYCYRCGAKKNVKQIAEDLGGSIAFTDSVQKYEDDGVIDANYWEHYIECPLAYDHEYLKKRRVSNEVVEHFSIRRTRRGVAFPLWNALKQLQGVQERLNVGNLRYLTHGLAIPYPMWLFPGYRDSFFIVEGVFGVYNGYRQHLEALAVLGASKAEKAGNWLKNRRFYVLFDDDQAGREAAGKLERSSDYSGLALLPGGAADEIDDWTTLIQKSNLGDRTYDNNYRI